MQMLDPTRRTKMLPVRRYLESMASNTLTIPHGRIVTKEIHTTCHPWTGKPLTLTLSLVASLAESTRGGIFGHWVGGPGSGSGKTDSVPGTCK